MKKLIQLTIFILVLFVASWAYAAGDESGTTTIAMAPGSGGGWSGTITPTQSGDGKGFVNVSVSGVTPQDTTWVATVTLQRSYDDGTTWFDVYQWTANAEHALVDMMLGMHYRIGIHQGDYTSGTINVTVWK